MKNRDFAIIVIVVLIAVVAVFGVLYCFVAQKRTSLGQPVSGGTSQSSQIQITSASLGSDGNLNVTVQNTGSTELVGVTLFLSPGPSTDSYSGGWNPDPSATYPILPGETTHGVLRLLANYRPGIQVIIYATGSFTNCQGTQPCEYTTTYTATVSG